MPVHFFHMSARMSVHISVVPKVLKTYLKFSFVRDPISRAISGYGTMGWNAYGLHMDVGIGAIPWHMSILRTRPYTCAYTCLHT